MRVLIIGCGYVGVPLGAELVRHGHEVAGVRRSLDRASELSEAGIRPIAADITNPDSMAMLPGPFDWIINLVSSGGSRGEDYRKTYFHGTENLLQRFQNERPAMFVYTSSTGVYGQTDGSTVCEDDPAVPSGETGKVLVDTENLLLDTWRESRFPAILLRIAGIYGPGRGYWFREFMNDRARITGSGNRNLNMIHRDDLVGVIAAILEGGQAGEIYNVVDNEPVRQIEFFRWLSGRTGRSMPETASEDIGDRRKRALTDKRVSNRKLVSEVNYHFRYPTFREGYAAELAAWGGGA